MRRSSRRFVFSCALSATAGCGDEAAAPPSYDSVTDGALYAVHVAPQPDPPRFGTNALKLQLSDSEGAPVFGAAFVIEPWMPGHGHGTPVVPTASEIGEGRYRVEDLYYMMLGRWELRVDISAPPGPDHVDVLLDVR